MTTTTTTTTFAERDERFDVRTKKKIESYRVLNSSKARPPSLLRDARSVGLEPVQQISPRLASLFPARGSHGTRPVVRRRGRKRVQRVGEPDVGKIVRGVRPVALERRVSRDVGSGGHRDRNAQRRDVLATDTPALLVPLVELHRGSAARGVLGQAAGPYDDVVAVFSRDVHGANRIFALDFRAHDASEKVEEHVHGRQGFADRPTRHDDQPLDFLGDARGSHLH
mmetsp:Transcript_14024/g.59074  ORF Transcript_14024/g.59074 Transcript_14024/m.59074 type:complete len:225 (+) Transcript_14024:1584-2258(+)